VAERQDLAISGHELAGDQRIAGDARRSGAEPDSSAQQKPGGAYRGAAPVRDGGIVAL
jgi:hypothetical protein